MADVWSGLRVRPMTVDEATRVASWRYAGQWSVYDLTSARPLVDDLASYYAVVAGETLIGFCCIGAAALRFNVHDLEIALLRGGQVHQVPL